MDMKIIYDNYTRLQIIFCYEQVTCQVRDQTRVDKETVWSDKKIPIEREKIKNSTKQPILLLYGTIIITEEDVTVLSLISLL